MHADTALRHGRVVEVAIWFHDAVYKVGVSSGYNERASQQMTSVFLTSLSINEDVANRVTQPVLSAIDATMHDDRDLGGSFTREPQIASMLMVDLDLAGFADPWETFQENNARIRQEYSRYSDDEYRWGRVKFLTDLMGKRIYHLLAELEAPAKANIKRHVAELLG